MGENTTLACTNVTQLLPSDTISSHLPPTFPSLCPALLFANTLTALFPLYNFRIIFTLSHDPLLFQYIILMKERSVQDYVHSAKPTTIPPTANHAATFISLFSYLLPGNFLSLTSLWWSQIRAALDTEWQESYNLCGTQTNLLGRTWDCTVSGKTLRWHSCY